MRPGTLLLTVVLSLASRAGQSQTAKLSGSVLRDSAGHPLAGAEISLPQLQRSTKANAFGDYLLDKLPAGRYLVVAQAPGLAPVQDTIAFTDGKEMERDFILAVKAQTVTPVAAGPGPSSKAPPLRKDPNIITAEELNAELASQGETNMYDVIQHLRPAMFAPKRGSNAGPMQQGVTASASDAGTIKVYLNTTRVDGDLTGLREITPGSIKEVRYLDAGEATQRFGIGNTGGAILLISR